MRLSNMQQKRFQYWSNEGLVWSEWFNYRGKRIKWQLEGKLKNEYRETESPTLPSSASSKKTLHGSIKHK